MILVKRYTKITKTHTLLTDSVVIISYASEGQ